MLSSSLGRFVGCCSKESLHERSSSSNSSSVKLSWVELVMEVGGLPPEEVGHYVSKRNVECN